VHHSGLQAAKERLGCHLCDRTFKHKYNRDCHVRRDHEGIMLKCEECSREFGVRESLNRHIKIVHEKQKPYTCPGEMSLLLGLVFVAEI
jgi:hypothetical protein